MNKWHSTWPDQRLSPAGWLWAQPIIVYTLYKSEPLALALARPAAVGIVAGPGLGPGARLATRAWLPCALACVAMSSVAVTRQDCGIARPLWLVQLLGCSSVSMLPALFRGGTQLPIL